MLLKIVNIGNMYIKQNKIQGNKHNSHDILDIHAINLIYDIKISF